VTCAEIRPARFAVALALLATLLSESATSEAAETSGRVVNIVATGDPAATRGVEEVVRELLARLPVDLAWSAAARVAPQDVLERPAGDSGIVVRVWIDLSDAARAKIYAVHVSSDRFIVRILPLGHGYDEVAREALGHVVESAVDAFLAGGQIGMTRDRAEEEVRRQAAPAELPPRASPPPTPVRSGADRRLTLALVYEATVAAASPVLPQGPGLNVAWAFGAGTTRFVAGASARYRIPYVWDAASIGATFDGAALRLVAGAELPVGRAILVRMLGGFGPEVAYVRPHAVTGGAASARAPSWGAAPIVTAVVNVAAELSRRFELQLGAGADFDVSHTHYDVAQAGGTVQVLSPWPLRPLVYVGPAVTFE
jgi:hypothetical protein